MYANVAANEDMPQEAFRPEHELGQADAREVVMQYSDGSKAERYPSSVGTTEPLSSLPTYFQDAPPAVLHVLDDELGASLLLVGLVLLRTYGPARNYHPALLHLDRAQAGRALGRSPSWSRKDSSSRSCRGRPSCC